MEFQSTLPREERRKRNRGKKRQCNFNPRSHERSDRSKTIYDMIEEISIHAPTRGATKKPMQSRQRRRDFNPRSHERSDVVEVYAKSTLTFQSTLPREERRIRNDGRGHLQRFQSTLPREERPTINS